MHVSTSVTLSGGDLAADAAGLRALPEGLLTELAQVAADYGTPAVLLAARERRGTLSMSNNKKATMLDALPIVRPGEETAEAEIVAVPRGAWHLVEYGAKAHRIDPRRKYGARAASRALNVPPYGIYAAVDHPGTAPNPVWEGAMADAEPVIDEQVQAAWTARIDTAEGGATP